MSLCLKEYICFPNPYTALITRVFQLPAVNNGMQHDSTYHSLQPVRSAQTTDGNKGQAALFITANRTISQHENIAGEK